MLPLRVKFMDSYFQKIHMTAKCKPFLRWPGGKRWFVQHYSNLLPQTFNIYHEPFLGSGAVFFHLNPKQSIISDVNEWLMDTYRAIQSNYILVEEYLAQYQALHCKDFYYSSRNAKHTTLHKRAAQFIYLNRACWNGLFRVNRKGEFNVPIGTRSNISRVDELKCINESLSGAYISSECFTRSIKDVASGDFVFVDPPYTVKHNNNGFIKYNETLFSWNDQVMLRDLLYDAHIKGAKILLLNANHESVISLYEGFGSLHELNRNSMLAASSTFRGKTTEIAIKIGY